MARRGDKQRFEKYIFRLCNHMRTLYFADEYQMEISFDDHPPVSVKGPVLAAIACDTTYLNMRIYITSELYEIWRSGDYHEVISTIAHEFAHLITEPLWAMRRKSGTKIERQQMWDILERQTQRISNLVMSMIVEPEWLPAADERPGK